MTTIVTRAGKGSALTWTEGDANITNLNNDKMENFIVAGDSGTNQTISGGNTLTIAGGTNLNSVASGTDIITVNLDTTITGLTSLTSTTVVTDTISSTTTNGPIVIAPDGTGDVHLNADSVRIGDNNSDATIATRGTGDLILTTNEGSATEGVIRIYDGVNGNITITPNGSGNIALTPTTGKIILGALDFPTGMGTNGQVLTTNGSSALSFTTINPGMTSFTAAGDSGTSQTIGDGNTLTITGGTGLSSVASATDTITINLDNTAVTAASYTYASITVDAQGRITSASNGATPLTSGGALGTPSSGNLSNCTADGTNSVGFRSIPSAGAEKTGSYTLATSDRAEFVQVASGGSITVPNSTFAAGDVVVVYNNHTAAITITLSTTNAYIAGTNTNKTSVSLATRGVCNILFISSTVAILTGNVS